MKLADELTGKKKKVSFLVLPTVDTDLLILSIKQEPQDLDFCTEGYL